MKLAARDGSEPVISLSSVPIRLGGEPAILVVGHDITERKRAEAERQKLETRMLQAQKFESLSILTAGIAHDFNNTLMAIVTNAAEAIGEAAGTVEITTRLVTCTLESLAEIHLGEGLAEGSYVCLEVTDDGCGMTPDVMECVLDPFFTTKFHGRGLGLPAVLGIVRSHRGAIRIHSVPGRGSTFAVYLPSVPQAMPATVATATSAQAAQPGRCGTVLVVDNEETIRHLAGRMLERLGFRILDVCDGKEAVAVFRRRQDEIDCVVMDLTMPRMDGLRVFEGLRCIRGDVRVLISSGHSEAVVAERFAGAKSAGFLQKPYSLTGLEHKFRQLGALTS